MVPFNMFHPIYHTQSKVDCEFREETVYNSAELKIGKG